jgi:hypothetical protein
MPVPVPLLLSATEIAESITGEGEQIPDHEQRHSEALALELTSYFCFIYARSTRTDRTTRLFDSYQHNSTLWQFLATNRNREHCGHCPLSNSDTPEPPIKSKPIGADVDRNPSARSRGFRGGRRSVLCVWSGHMGTLLALYLELGKLTEQRRWCLLCPPTLFGSGCVERFVRTLRGWVPHRRGTARSSFAVEQALRTTSGSSSRRKFDHSGKLVKTPFLSRTDHIAL